MRGVIGGDTPGLCTMTEWRIACVKQAALGEIPLSIFGAAEWVAATTSNMTTVTMVTFAHVSLGIPSGRASCVSRWVAGISARW